MSHTLSVDMVGAALTALGLIYAVFLALCPRSSTPDIKHEAPAPDSLSSSDSIVAILQRAAKSPGHLKIYVPDNLETPIVVSYQHLYDTAKAHARRLRLLPGWRPGRICLILLDRHYSNIQWFWSVVLAEGIPVMCPSFASKDVQSNLEYLDKLLSRPLCLTTQARLQLSLSHMKNVQAYTIEELETRRVDSCEEVPMTGKTALTATIMLTSGSSGNSKAVPLSHAQILSCLVGKSHVFTREPDATTLNWVGMDHVAGLVEAHMRALWARVDQVHVEAQDVTSSPDQYLRLLGLHKISASFAPQFLLAKIVDGVDSNRLQLPQDLDLSSLRTITSGGEALSTDICSRFSRLLERYGAPNNAVVSGFGMTETGAGCIFHRFGPTSSPVGENQVMPVGKCVPGVEMRISPLVDQTSISTSSVRHLAVGNLEIRGPIVFPGYISNDEANEASFTSDGWFRTGDMGSIDSNGNLTLTGRSKELICVNGVKYLSEDQERLLADAKIPGVSPDHVVCFAWRPSGAPTEQFCVCYEHSYEANDCAARATAQRLVVRAFLMNTGTRPHVLPLPPGVLQKSTLGKISRTKVRMAFEQGCFADADALNSTEIKATTVDTLVRPANSAEDAVLNIIASVLQLDPVKLGVETDYFESGLTSVDLFKMRSLVCRHFGLSSLSVETLIKHNTVRSLCQAVLNISGGHGSRYDPVVQLKSKGAGTPLWLVHPGVGEVLVFVGLAHHIQDRPVFALRARGFEDGDGVFGSIDEVVTTYVEAIKSRQAQGPYAIAGYSYGSMLAFEISKRLERMGDSVPFLGCFNLPPHIKSRMRQLSRQNCLIHLAMFLQLISDDQSATLQRESVDQPFEQVLNSVLSQADQARFCELALTRESLLRWVHVAFSLQSMAVDYEPAADVQNLDVFYCDPLTAVARSKQEWLEEQLSKWTSFCRTLPKFHSVTGGHYTMLSNVHVRGFHAILAKALVERGL